METPDRISELIDYEKDPSTSSDINAQFMYNQLESYIDINRTKKQPTKKTKKGILKTAEFDK